jgi:ubiquinone/menaquinone biosynthesis C-methylase UbiE
MPDFGPPEELFRETARYYSQFRPPYPDEAIDAIVRRFALEDGRWVIDLGCGTGQVGIPLAARGARVCAVDPATGMLEEGRGEAARAGVDGVEWLLGDDLSFERVVPAREYALCTIGAAFHWMDRDRVLATLKGLIAQDGGVVVVANSVSVWSEEAAWAGVARDVIVEYLGASRRAGAGTYDDPPERHEALLERSVFTRIETRYIVTPQVLGVEDIVGLQLSSSYASPALLGARQDAFCETLRRRLLELSPAGTFEWEMTTELITATR